MNSAEIEFWGEPEAITDFLSMIRRPGERPSGYDSTHSFEFGMAYAKCIGEAGETLLAELLKMKGASEAETAPETVAQELVAV